MPATSTIDPSMISSSSATFSLPSPSYSAPSPSPSCEGPPRKRPRSELSSEERKEARAHRNRIAAQNSRDRRKAHYGNLEQRVAELEEENRLLRAGHMPQSSKSAQEDHEREAARQKENDELRERIKTLEKGWDAVVKALAAQGLPTGISIPTTSTAAPSPTPQEHTGPVIVPNQPTYSYPISPAPSNASLTVGVHRGSSPLGAPAAGGPASTTDSQLFTLETFDTLPLTSQHDAESAVSDAAMEDLFREILAPPSPAQATTSLPLPLDSRAEMMMMSTESKTAATGSSVVDWESEVEMQRLLDMLPDIQSSSGSLSTMDDSLSASSGLEFDLESEWSMGAGAGISVF
ncbi:hypothetical protein HWV62_8891 [Athelia sp. TMB]|nr:hypothetical protein HWV62_8891 [Athelia sp. TMB]